MNNKTLRRDYVFKLPFMTNLKNILDFITKQCYLIGQQVSLNACIYHGGLSKLLEKEIDVRKKIKSLI